MNILIIIAHGSRHKESNQEIIQLCKKIEQQKSNNWQLILPAFLEIAKPDLTETLKQAVTYNPQHITIFPYFLANGEHVQKNIPQIIKSFQQQYKIYNITLQKHLGAATNMPQFILKTINNNLTT